MGRSAALQRTDFFLVLRRRNKFSKCGTYYVSLERENTFGKEKQREKRKEHTHTHTRNNTKKKKSRLGFFFSHFFLNGGWGRWGKCPRKDEKNQINWALSDTYIYQPLCAFLSICHWLLLHTIVLYKLILEFFNVGSNIASI